MSSYTSPELSETRVGLCILLVIGLGVSLLLGVPTTGAQAVSVRIVSFKWANNFEVNGTFAASFLLQSQSRIFSVHLNFTNSADNSASIPMTLVDGNNTYGWWKATITPKVLSETFQQQKSYRLEPMALQVTTDSGTAVVPIGPGLLPNWSTQVQSAFLPVLDALRLVASYAFLIAVGLAVLVAVLVIRNGRKR